MLKELAIHCMTLAMIAFRYFSTDAHPEGSYKRASRRTVKLAKRGKVRRSEGIVDHDFITVYATKLIKNVNHELGLTKLWLLYEEYWVARSPNLPHNADGKIRVGNKVFWIEWDCGSEKVRQIRERMKQYFPLPPNEFVVFVCPNNERAELIMSLAGQASSVLFVTTFADCERDPLGLILTDCTGARDSFLSEEERYEE